MAEAWAGMVCRRSLLKKCRGVDIRAAHSPRVASAVDSRSDTRAGKQAGNRTADTPGAGGWPSAKMPAAPKERQQWAVRGAAHRPEAVHPRRRAHSRQRSRWEPSW